MRWTPWRFFFFFLGGWGWRWWVLTMGALTENEEWRVGRWGLSPKFFRMRVYLIHLNTFLRGSTHFTFHGGALISYICISCFHDDVIKWKHVPRHWLLCGEFIGDYREFTGEFTSHRPVTRSFDVFFDLRLNKRLSKQSRRRWFETP